MLLELAALGPKVKTVAKAYSFIGAVLLCDFRAT
jgi:hypothetical protein